MTTAGSAFRVARPDSKPWSGRPGDGARQRTRLRWQGAQSVLRFSGSLEPPAASGTMWSTSNLPPWAPQRTHRCPSRSSTTCRVRCQVQPLPPRAALFWWLRGTRRAATHRGHRDLRVKAPQSRHRCTQAARPGRRSRYGRTRRRMAAGSLASARNTLLNCRCAPQRRHDPSAMGPSGSGSRQ